VAGIKRALSASDRNELHAQLDLEAEHQVGCFESEEAREKIAAFARK
jgi:enoyl-CoA hydratase/carnithine racemase